MKKLLFILPLALAISACVSVGTKVDAAKLASFETGKTTYSQVVFTLGTPQLVTKQSDGKKIISYAYATASPDAASFIPFFGAFVGSTDSDTTTVNFLFDADNKLESYNQSQSKASNSISGTKYKNN